MDTEINMTEFLTKSLVGAGVFLAIPAALITAYSLLALWSTWPYRWTSHAGWLLFCGIGFYLLVLSIRIVRHLKRVSRPRLVWVSVSAYLAVIVASGIAWLISAYERARQGDLRVWTSGELDASILLIPAIILLLPLWGFILSVALCIRSKWA